MFDRQCPEVGRQDQVCTPPRRKRAQLPLKPKMRGGVQRCHLQCHERIAPTVDSMSHHPIHMPFIYQSSRVAIISTKNEVTWIETFFGNGRYLRLYIIPRRAEPQHSPHTLTHTCNGIRFLRAFVVVSRTACHVSREIGP